MAIGQVLQDSLRGSQSTSIDAANAVLAQDIARLQKENAQLLHARLTRERARLAQENALLLVSTAGLSLPGLGVAPPPPGLGPPMMALQQSPRTNKWLAIDVSHSRQASTSSVVSTDVGSSVMSSMASSVSDDLDDARKSLDPTIPRTSLMMRNIPNCYSRRSLLELLDKHGFKGSYNLVYLPIDFNTNGGFGYAFVNFVDTESAQFFMSRLQGFRGWAIPSDKVLDVTWSNAHQGFEAHVERYRNSPMMHESVPDELKPVIFASGERIPFPPPTKKPRAPRTRRRS